VGETDAIGDKPPPAGGARRRARAGGRSGQPPGGDGHQTECPIAMVRLGVPSHAAVARSAVIEWLIDIRIPRLLALVSILQRHLYG
jgi:hypothetical protein